MLKPTGLVKKAALAAFLGSYAVSAHALFIDLWTTDQNRVRVEDQGAGDRNPALGVVSYRGVIDHFWFTWSVGQSKPAVGSPEVPEINLWSIDVSGGSGELNLMVYDGGFMPKGDSSSWRFVLDGETTGDHVTATAFIDIDGDQQMGGYDEELSILTGNGSFNEAWTDKYELELPSEYGVGILATVKHDSFLDYSKFSANVSDPIPEPATLALLGIGLAGFSFVHRRRLSA